MWAEQTMSFGCRSFMLLWLRTAERWSLFFFFKLEWFEIINRNPMTYLAVKDSRWHKCDSCWGSKPQSEAHICISGRWMEVNCGEWSAWLCGSHVDEPVSYRSTLNMCGRGRKGNVSGYCFPTLYSRNRNDTGTLWVDCRCVLQNF